VTLRPDQLHRNRFHQIVIRGPKISGKRRHLATVGSQRRTAQPERDAEERELAVLFLGARRLLTAAQAILQTYPGSNDPAFVNLRLAVQAVSVENSQTATEGSG